KAMLESQLKILADAKQRIETKLRVSITRLTNELLLVRSRLSQEVFSLKRAESNLKLRLASEKKEKTKVQNQLNSRISALKNSFFSLEQSKQNIQKQLQEARAKGINLEKLRKKGTAELEAKLSRLRSRRVQIETQLKGEIVSLRGAKQKLENELVSLEQVKNLAETKLKSALDSLNREKVYLQSRLESELILLKEAESKLKSQLIKEKAQRAQIEKQLNSQIALLKEEQAKLNEELRLVRNEKKAIESRLSDDVSRLKNEGISFKDEIAALRQAKKDRERELLAQLKLLTRQKNKMSELESFHQKAKDNLARGEYLSARQYLQKAQDRVREEGVNSSDAWQDNSNRKNQKKIQRFYRIAEKYYSVKDYDNAADFFEKILDIDPYSREAARYYQICLQKIMQREQQELSLTSRQKPVRFRSQKQKKNRIGQVKSLYKEAKGYFKSGEYIEAIVIFREVRELEKGFRPIYSSYAQEYIQRAQQKIREQEQLFIQKQAEEERIQRQEELTGRRREERLMRQAQERRRLSQLEEVYKEAHETYLDAKDKFEEAIELKERLEIKSSSQPQKYQEYRDHFIQEDKDYAKYLRTRKSKKRKAKSNRQPKSSRNLADEEFSSFGQTNLIGVTPKTLEYAIGQGDILYIHVWQEESLTQEVVVRPDGRISVPLAGDIQAVGLTFKQLKDKLIFSFKEYVRQPMVSVSLRKLGGKKVIILGEVRRPGVYSVTGKRTLLEAVALAGGFTPHAVLSSTILIKGGLRNPRAKRINLSRAIIRADRGQNVILQPEDIIYIPKKFIANINYALTQILGPIIQGTSAASGVDELR
ncbi:MAG: polysaccharide biosynthesis/export family protein, partial [Omnitrophica bacterium]|nr:polysaccharide biosynthesis/export family protein [Candidatus Omnitrophota bacterium]